MSHSYSSGYNYVNSGNKKVNIKNNLKVKMKKLVQSVIFLSRKPFKSYYSKKTILDTMKAKK